MVGGTQAPHAGAPAPGLRLLGPFQLAAKFGMGRAPGGVVEIGSAKQRLVLAVLALRLNQVVSRVALLERLWSDRPPASAIVTLQSLISRLRKALEGAGDFDLETREPGWVLCADPGSVDVAHFAALTTEARAHLAAGEAVAAAVTLRRALGLWRGEALVDLVEAGYLAAEATRLDESRLDAVEDLAEAELACGWTTDALARLEPHVAAQPLRERAWGQLMLALYHLGRQAEALRAYQRLRVTLGEELGIDPTPALVDLESRILRHDPALARPPAAPRPAAGESAADGPAPSALAAQPVATGSVERTPFVGRVAERAWLTAALERARAGSGGMVLIGGEPGIGKTRLADEAVAEAAGSGMAAFAGHSYEMAGASPYVAFVEILEGALAAAPSPEAFVAGILGDAAPEVARLVPQLRRRIPDLPAPLDMPPAQERLYLFRCLGDTLARLAATCPAMILLDDLQWADEPTLLFVEHFAPHLSRMPLLVVATYRDEEVGRPLAHLFETLHRQRLATRLRLGALSPSESSEVVGALSGQEPPAAIVDALHSITEGNVFFLEEVFRDLAEGGRLFDDQGRFRADADAGNLAVPEGVRLVLRRRLERLSDDAQRMMAIAALAGRVFSVRLLEAIGDLGLDRLLDVLDEAEEAMLIAPAATDDEYLFGHELIRQALAAGLSGARRRRVHRRVAGALIAVRAGNLDEYAAEIAHQLALAGDVADPKALFSFSLLAGQRALATSAFEEALAHLERAATLADHGGRSERAELFFGLGRAHHAQGRLDNALAAWERSTAEYEAVGDPEAVARTYFEAAVANAYGGRLRAADVSYRRGLDATETMVSPIRARLMSAMGMTLAISSADAAGADRCHAEAARIAASLGDDALSGLIAMHRSLACHAMMRPRESVETGLRGAGALRSAGEWWALGEGLWTAGASLVVLGRFDEAAAVFSEFEAVARRVGHPSLAFAQRYARPPEFYRSGDVDTLIRAIEKEIDQYLELMGGAWISWSYSQMGSAQFLRGDWDQAGQWHRKAVEGAVPSVYAGWCRGLSFLHLAYAGRREEALALFEEHRREVNLPAGPDANSGGWGLLLSFTEGLFVLGERALVAGWEPVIADVIGRSGAVLGYYVPGPLCERVAGIAALAAGDHAAAEGHFRVAFRQADELPHQVERLETRRFYAAMLAERNEPGDAEQARAALEEAVEGFTRLGMPRHADLSAQALKSL